MACEHCDKPCVRVGGKCIIALARKELNLTFKEAWEAIVRVNSKTIASAYVSLDIQEKVDRLLNRQYKLIRFKKEVK